MVVLLLTSLGAHPQDSTKQPASRPDWVAAQEERLAQAKERPVPEPPQTPFDSDPKAREIYLLNYRGGYRTILAEVMIDCHMGVAGPYLKAMQRGWQDGLTAGRKQYPEKAAKIYGMTLDEYLKSSLAPK